VSTISPVGGVFRATESRYVNMGGRGLRVYRAMAVSYVYIDYSITNVNSVIRTNGGVSYATSNTRAPAA
jgi:hypothetical protein